MSNNVFANGNAIACKAGDDKVIASMPDVCLSPPSPPAGPVPVPYPNTSFSKDMKSGSKTVEINGKEVMLKDKSFYKTSPLGDEAATNSFGGSVITHTITGKTYFSAWSMDVKFEGENVPRHLDLTTSNHNPYPGSTAPLPAQEKAMKLMSEGKCPCCEKDNHGGYVVMGVGDVALTRDEWYGENILRNPQHSDATKLRMLDDYDKLIAEVTDMQKKKKKGEPTPCSCEGPTKVVPEAPCDVFFYNPDPAEQLLRHDNDVAAWKDFRDNTGWQNSKNIPRCDASANARVKKKLKKKGIDRDPTTEEKKNERQTNHLTPKGAGCPTGDGNLQPHKDLCDYCKGLDKRFNPFQ